MSKQLKIYSIDELINHNFDDKEFVELSANNNLLYSLIISMFKFVKSKYSQDKILEVIKIDNWMENKFWSWEEHDNYIKLVAQAYKNIYRYGDDVSIKNAQNFVFKYGFKVKDTKANENKHMKRICKIILD